MRDQDPSIRIIAGLALKNNVSRYYKTIHPNVMHYVKSNVVLALADPLDPIRSTAGTIITTIVSSFGLNQWPEILAKLLELMDHPEVKIKEVRSYNLVGP